MQKAIQEIINKLDKVKTKKEFNNLKLKISKKYHLKKIPTTLNIILSMTKEQRKKYSKLLEIKPIRSLSGVSVVAAMIRPYKCPHGRCIMCPTVSGVTQSYTGREPASKRAVRNKFNAYLQVFNRLEQYMLMGKDISKIELIIMGGNFTSTPKKYQKEFVKLSLQAMNDFSKKFVGNFEKFIEFFEIDYRNEMNEERDKKINAKILKIIKETTLEKEIKKNEKSKVRCVAMAVETRPDSIDEKQIELLLNLGVTRIEVGVQHIDDEVLKKIQRGHLVEDTIQTVKLLKDAGYKIGYHLLIGAPGSSNKKDLEMVKKIFSDERFKPDALKIYPCMVFENTELHSLWKEKKFKPINTDDASKLISKMKKYVPKYCRIMRVQRDIPSYLSSAGVDRTNLRQYLTGKCRCIRCRQPKADYDITKGKIKLNKFKYKSSEGDEYFLSIEDEKQDVLLGFCRLRIKDQAIIRELHVYSTTVSVGDKPIKKQIQHRGYGKKLMAQAEEIGKKEGKKELIVISGIGVREYYKRLGYKKKGNYMIKKL